jgi:putative addiction module component (TIGR02574 family)
MPQPPLPPRFDDLSTDEKLHYIQAPHWDDFAEHPEEVPLPDWHRQVIAERLAAYRRREATAPPWTDVREELLARLQTVR